MDRLKLSGFVFKVLKDVVQAFEGGLSLSAFLFHLIGFILNLYLLLCSTVSFLTILLQECKSHEQFLLGVYLSVS